MTGRQRRFVQEYLKDLNATAAAKRAGFSPRTANQAGHRLLAKPHVMLAIEAGKAEIAERAKVDAVQVLRELMAIVRTSPMHFTTDAAGEVITVDPDDTESWRAVAGVKRRTRVIPQKVGDPIVETFVEIRLTDKNAAIEKAMRHLNLLSADITVNVNVLERFLLARHENRQNGHRVSA